MSATAVSTQRVEAVLECGECGTRTAAPKGYIGKTAKCPACKESGEVTPYVDVTTTQPEDDTHPLVHKCRKFTEMLHQGLAFSTIVWVFVAAYSAFQGDPKVAITAALIGIPTYIVSSLIVIYGLELGTEILNEVNSNGST